MAKQKLCNRSTNFNIIWSTLLETNQKKKLAPEYSMQKYCPYATLCDALLLLPILPQTTLFPLSGSKLSLRTPQLSEQTRSPSLRDGGSGETATGRTWAHLLTWWPTCAVALLLARQSATALVPVALLAPRHRASYLHQHHRTIPCVIFRG